MCKGDANACVGSGGGVVKVNAFMGCARGACVLSSAGGVLEMSVMRGVGGVCDMCMCLARAGGRSWVRVGDRIGFAHYQYWRKMGKVGYVSVFWWCWGRVCGRLGPGGRVCGRLGPGSGRVLWCYVSVCYKSGFSVLMAAITVICIPVWFIVQLYSPVY